MRMTVWAVILIVAGAVGRAGAQSSSIGQTYGPPEPTPAPQATPAPEETRRTETNPTIDRNSLIAVQLKPPTKFKINDLLTIVVREQTSYEAEGTANTRRQADYKSELDAFIKFTGGGVGATTFSRGKPNIDYTNSFNQRVDAESDREDKLSTRITGTIIDVKPNGNLVFEATRQIEHEDQKAAMTLTGTCRTEDVTPDNSVLSTQIANLEIKVTTAGSIRDARHQGWLAKIIDVIRPL